MDREEIKRIRLDLGLTQVQMARACGVWQSHYAAWESGGKRPSRIAQRLVLVLSEAPSVAARLGAG